MSTTATAQINISANVNYQNTVGTTVYSGSPQITANLSLTNTDVSKVFSGSYTGSGTTTLDVNSGLTDAYGNALVFASVKTLVVRNTHATASVVVGGGSNPLLGTDQYTVKAGKTLAITSPFTVDGTHKVLTFTPSASCTFDVLIVGS